MNHFDLDKKHNQDSIHNMNFPTFQNHNKKVNAKCNCTRERC